MKKLLVICLISNIITCVHLYAQIEPFNNLKQKSAITYQLNGCRLGDNLLNYCHAKWLSYHHQLPLLYVPFEYSEKLYIDKLEPLKYDHYQSYYQKTITIFLANDPRIIEPDKNILYKIGYFPEWGIAPNTYFTYFAVDWNDPIFKQEIQKTIRPTENLITVQPPKNMLSIAVHIRTGGGFDRNWWMPNSPEKFLTDTFYAQGIRQIIASFPQQPVYIYIFTDHEHPEAVVSKFREYLKDIPLITWDYRKQDNHHEKNVLEDLFSIIHFDCLVRSESNYAFIASKIGNFKMEITPKSKYDSVYYAPGQPHSVYGI